MSLFLVAPAASYLVGSAGPVLCRPLLPGVAAPRAAVCLQQQLGGGGGGDDGLGDAAMARLRDRITKIQESGLATSAQAYFDIATEKPPQRLLRDFFADSAPRVQQAMQDAVVALLGALPTLQFDSSVTTTGDRLAALMLQLQVTGYMLRNAEYATALRDLLEIRSREPADFRAAFERLDADGSGYIEMPEVEALLASVYGGEAPPPYEARALMKLMDADGDGRIAWDEFSVALGALEGEGGSAFGAALPALDAAAGTASPPNVSGTVVVTLDGGREVEVDAAAYMEQLRGEAEALRSELGQLQAGEAEGSGAISTSLSAYVAALPEARRSPPAQEGRGAARSRPGALPRRRSWRC